jgi:hypothetical protein
MTNGIERIWKELAVVYFKVIYYPGICMEGLRKTQNISFSTSGLRADKRTTDLLNINQGPPKYEQGTS